MVDSHIQHCLKYEFDRGSSVKIALKNIHDTYGDDSLSDSTCRQYFKKYKTKRSSDDVENGESECEAGTVNGKQNVLPPKKIRRGAAPKQFVKPIVVKKGFKFIDTQKSEFVVGREIGIGGFGRIYEAKQVATNKMFAVKMEPHTNGPLFTEIHVYLKILKEQQIAKWKKENGVDFVGLPLLISSGKLTYENEELRYLVIPKYLDSVESALARNETCFSLAQHYVHGDAKAANLLMEKKNDFEHVFLIDFGLARKLPDMPVEKEDKKSAHNGTLEFTSCDAHRGCLPSFRGDLEILAHNMVYWLTGSLPWENEQDPMKVFKAKKHLIENVEMELPKLIKSKKAVSAVELIYKTVRKTNYVDQFDVPSILKSLA